jgi:hypothetical protein
MANGLTLPDGTIDYCAVAEGIRQAIAQRVVSGGEQVLEVRIGERVVKYGSMSLVDLRAELTKYENLCAIQTAAVNGVTTSPRFAIRGGSVRYFP